MFLLFLQLCLCQRGPRWNLTDLINWLLYLVEAEPKLSDIGGTSHSEMGEGLGLEDEANTVRGNRSD